MPNTKTLTPRTRKSVALTAQEIEKLSIFCSRYPTDVERAEALELQRPTFIRIRQFGSGSQANINALRLKLKHVKIVIVEQM